MLEEAKMNTSSHSTNWKLVRLLFTVILLAAWVSSCGQSASETPGTEGPPTEAPTSEPTEEPTTEPTQEPERQPCEGGDGNFTCKGEREITLDGVPSGVTPYLLTITPEFREFLLGPDAQKSPETSCIFMLAGDLAFYNEDDELITSFDSAVTIEYAFLPEDEDAYLDCQKMVQEFTGIAAEDVEYVPVYYDQETWKPFKNYVVDTETGLMTIEFASWGDQPIGGGTRP
jgi:hypothetical protein